MTKAALRLQSRWDSIIRTRIHLVQCTPTAKKQEQLDQLMAALFSEVEQEFVLLSKAEAATMADDLDVATFHLSNIQRLAERLDAHRDRLLGKFDRDADPIKGEPVYIDGRLLGFVRVSTPWVGHRRVERWLAIAEGRDEECWFETYGGAIDHLLSVA